MMLRATKVRIYPTPEQAKFLNAQFGAVRFAYNKALHIKKQAYLRHGVSLSPRKDLKPLLAVAKKSRKYAWLKTYDSIALQQAVINLDVAFSNFFNPKPTLISVVTGLDMGLSHYAIQSNGVKIPNPRHLMNASRNLRRKQKALSRKKKGSANRRKARIRLAGVHERVANSRADFQHKLSRAIVDENQAVIVETLKVANMMKNPPLARAIGDAGWSGFIAKLEYKAAEKGVHVVKLEQWFASSKTRHCCGHKMLEMPLNKRIWQCPECGVEHDRDINAAINIERKGILELQAAGLVVSTHGGQHKSVAETVAA